MTWAIAAPHVGDHRDTPMVLTSYAVGHARAHDSFEIVCEQVEQGLSVAVGEGAVEALRDFCGGAHGISSLFREKPLF